MSIKKVKRIVYICRKNHKGRVLVIGIIAAMEKEMDAITSLLMTNGERYRVSGIAMVKGSIREKCHRNESGVGRMPQWRPTILFENCLFITALLNIGTAGGLKDQQVLDAVLSTRVVQRF